jgi:hypothetical protein
MMHKTYGVLVRVYTPKAEEVPARVERAVAHAQQLATLWLTHPVIQRIAFVVPSEYDCGATATALEDQLLEEGMRGIDVWSLPGHHSCEVLNEGIARLQLAVTHAVIISGKAMSYLTVEAMNAVDQAFADSAKVAGVAVDELREVVLSGRIQNTFAAWDIDALRGVGGFDSSLGIEEIAPTARLAEKYGRCIAPLDAAGGALNIAPSETARARHLDVMTTKLARQRSEAERVGSSFEQIMAAILPGYPRHI